MKRNILIRLLVSIAIEVIKLFKSDAKESRKRSATSNDHNDHEHNSKTNQSSH